MLSFDLVLPRLFVGTAPGTAQDARRLRRALGVTAVLNLQSEEDFARWRIDWSGLQDAYREERIVVEHVPIRDFDAQSLITHTPEAVDRLAQLLDVGHRVYLHCTAGQQRSPAAAIAYLVLKRGYTLDDAIGEILNRRSCAPDIDALRTLLAPVDKAAGGDTDPVNTGNRS